MINFLHTFNPESILISLGPIDIYWYGFFILIGSLLAISIMIKLASYHNIEKEKIIDLAFYLIITGITGARIYHIFLEFPYYLKYPLDMFKIWQGGLAIHGGIIAGLIVIWLFAKKRKELSSEASELSSWLWFWLLTAILVPGLALAQALGRWGNYFNQELFGLPTDKPWGIPIEIANRPLEYINSEFFHPTFLYESLGSLLIFFILIAIHVWIIKNQKQKSVMRYALCVISYLILYSILRFSLEFIRIDKTPELLGLRFPQIISLIIIFLTPILLLLPKLKNNVNIK